MGKFDPPCGRPKLPPSDNPAINKRRKENQIDPRSLVAKCGRKQLAPSSDPKIQARREKARANALKKREAVKQQKAGTFINENIKMKIARKLMDKAKQDANPAPAPAQAPAPVSANPFGGLSSFNKNRINKGRKKTGLIFKPPTPAPAPAPVLPPVPSPAQSPIPASSSSVKPNPSQTPFNKAKIIANFLKNKLILNKYTLQNRINRYNVVNKALEALSKNDCLEKDGEGYKIGNIAKLEKKIGTASKFGTIYLTSIPNTLGSFPIASKVMKDTTDNLLETELMKRITDTIILTGKSKHFAIMYKYSLCKDVKVKKKLRLVDYNEVCNGDLSALVKDRDVVSNEEHFFNILVQVFISLATFHNSVGYVHKDTHYGNFLYQLNNETGYYHYKAGATEFYLKSSPHNMIIYDFGFSQMIENTTPQISISLAKYIYGDYVRILNAFLGKRKGWGEFDDIPTPAFEDKIISMRNIMNNNIYYHLTGTNPSRATDYAKDLFIYMLKPLINNAPKGMILTNRPANVINSTPYLIFN